MLIEIHLWEQRERCPATWEGQGGLSCLLLALTVKLRHLCYRAPASYERWNQP